MEAILGAWGLQPRRETRRRWKRWRTAVGTLLVLLATVYTTVGKAAAVDRLDGTTSLFMEYGAWGTGAGTAVVGDTTLFTEASEARVAVTKSQPAADTNQALFTITANGTKTITNAGTFTASSAGVLIVKGDFTGVAMLLGDSIQFTVTLQQT